MKNKISILLVSATIIFIVLGCSLTDRVQKAVTGDDKTSPPSSGDNRSIGNKTIDAATDGETTGIPECDQVFKTISDKITKESAKDDNWASRATRNLFYSQIKKGIRKAVEENNKDANGNANNENIIDVCRDYEKQLEAEIKKDEEQGK